MMILKDVTKVKGEIKFTPEEATQAHRWGRNIALLFL